MNQIGSLFCLIEEKDTGVPTDTGVDSLFQSAASTEINTNPFEFSYFFNVLASLSLSPNEKGNVLAANENIMLTLFSFFYDKLSICLILHALNFKYANGCKCRSLQLNNL